MTAHEPQRLDRIRQELDEMSESLARIADEIARAKPVVRGDDLVGTSEAAALLGIARTSVTRAYARGTFPEPVAVLAMGPVWLRQDIETHRDRRAA